MTTDKDGKVHLAYTVNNEEADGLYGELQKISTTAGWPPITYSRRTST